MTRKAVVSQTETPDQVHGRLMESVHLSGYSFDRACAELEWLIEGERWKSVGAGFEDPGAFLGTVDLSPFNMAATDRKRLVEKLAVFGASQRAIGRSLGVGEQTVARDLGKDRRGAPMGAPMPEEPREDAAVEQLSAPNGAVDTAPQTRGGARHRRDPRAEHLRLALREIRSARKLSQGQIASRLSATETTLRRIVSQLEEG